MKSIGILAMFFAALTAPAQGTATFEWKGTIQAKQTLEIRNINGDIKAETAPGPDVEISVRIVGTRPDPGAIRINVVQHDGGILVCTIYEGLSHPDHCAPDQTPTLSLTNSDIRVTYTVRVPADVDFVPRTVNGNISADLPGGAIAIVKDGPLIFARGYGLADVEKREANRLATAICSRSCSTRRRATIPSSTMCTAFSSAWARTRITGPLTTCSLVIIRRINPSCYVFIPRLLWPLAC